MRRLFEKGLRLGDFMPRKNDIKFVKKKKRRRRKRRRRKEKLVWQM